MKVLRPISAPLAGERAVAVAPPIAPYTFAVAGEVPPAVRLNLFAGRALTHLALTQEQRARGAAVARLALGVAPGVVDGLEVALEGAGLAVMPGHAIAASGEDMELHTPLRLDPEILELWPAALSGWLTDDPADAPVAALIARGAPVRLKDLRALGRLAALPHALVLTAVPVAVAIDRTGELDSPCANAVEEGAFSELAWEDGFKWMWMPWPADLPVPPWSLDGAAPDPRFRNRLAYALFNGERARVTTRGATSVRRFFAAGGAGADTASSTPPWPWEAAGAPLSLVGFDADYRPLFADRAAVVRQGGGRRNRTPLVALAGEDTLWQARVAQLVEHLAEIPEAERSAEHIARQFDWLPPAGVLPVTALDVERGRQFVFPASFDVQAQPVPLDMVDALIAESAALAPFNLSLRDQVQLLVPVPSRHYEPDLLKLDERIHPLFDAEVGRLERQRLALLASREALRRRFDVLSKTVGGEYPGYPEDDPEGLPDEGGAADAMALPRVRRAAAAAGARQRHAFTGAHARLALAASDALVVFVKILAAPAALVVQAVVEGAPALPLVFGDATLEPGGVAAGPLPAAGEWVRLTVPAALAGLAGKTLDGLGFAVVAGAAPAQVLWGHAGKLVQGREHFWLTDALPHGATPVTAADWNWEDHAPAEALDDVALGTPTTGEARRVAEVDRLVASYQAYLGGALAVELGEPKGGTPSLNPRLADAGLGELIQRLQGRIAAASDHIEFGFLRARTDIYRVRQSVLGTEDAGRLLTSPSAAELVKRGDSPVATEKEFAEYFTRASAKVVEKAPTPAAAPRALTFGAAAISTKTSGSAPLSGAISTTMSKPVAETILKADVVSIAPTEKAAPSVEAARLISGEVPGAKLAGAAAAPTTKDVAGDSLFSASFNTVTVGERLTGSAAIITSNAAAKGKSDFVAGGVGLLKDSGLVIADLPVYGFKDPAKPDAEAGKVTAGDLIAGTALVDLDAQELTGTDLHEAAFFKRGLDAIDNMVRFLRRLELRAEDYRRLQNDAIAARNRILATLQGLDARIGALEGRLAEVRHDLSVARALRAEELARVAALIARRKAVLASEVPYVVFRRPRLTRNLDDVPVLQAETALVPDPVPACRTQAGAAPPELQRMVDTLRDVPAQWLKRIPPLIHKFDRVEHLQMLAGTVQARLAAPLAKASELFSDDSRTGSLLKLTQQRQEKRLSDSHAAAATLAQGLALRTWKEAAVSLERVATVGDLIRTPAPHKEITLEAAGELDDIAGVAACLYGAFSRVPPATRLRWAELFSQLDPAVSLRVLTVLPGFGDEALGVDSIEWRQMQRLVDWLFSRVAPVDEAVAAINDVVRVALLLAAHAPVKRIISARVRRPVAPVPGARLELELDPRIARIGMQVLVHAPATQTVVARAVIQDIGADGAVAHIAQVMTPAVTIDASMRVQLQSGPALSTPAAEQADQRSVAPAAKKAAPAAKAGKGQFMQLR